jgi:hypothetical protein
VRQGWCAIDRAAEGGVSGPPGDLDVDLAELRALRRDAQALSRRLATSRQGAAETSAFDPAGCVCVALAGDDRVASVEVVDGWRRRIEVHALGPAVVAALEEAVRQRAMAWAQAVSEGPVADPHGADDGPASSASGSGVDLAWPDPAGAAEFARRLFYVVQDAAAGLDAVVADAARRAAQVTTARDRHARVVVTLTGAAVTAIDIDGRWARHAGHEEIGAAIMAGIRAGYAAVDELVEASPLRRWPYAELDRMTGDPTQLLAGLGLPVSDELAGRR